MQSTLALLQPPMSTNSSIEGMLRQPPLPQHKMLMHTSTSLPLPQPPSTKNSVDGTTQPEGMSENYFVGTETTLDKTAETRADDNIGLMTTLMSTTLTIANGTEGTPSFAATPSSTTANKDKEEVPMLNAPTTGNTTKEGTEGSTNEVCIMLDMFFFKNGIKCINSLYGFITNS
jgi:hypothetical protein